MEEWMNRLSDEPAFAALMVALIAAVLFFVVRRLLVLALVCAIAFAGVVGYFAYTGEEPPESLKKITEKAKEGAEIVSEKAAKAKEKLGEELKEAAKTGVKEALEE